MNHGHAPAHTEEPATAPLEDPVCRMKVTEASPHRHDHAGRTYYFCCEPCRAKFAADPEHYLNKSERKQEPVPEGTDAELPRSAAPRRAHRRAVGPRTPGVVVLPARLRDGPSPELCYEPFALCFQVLGLNLARLEDRFCFLRAFLGVALRG